MKIWTSEHVFSHPWEKVVTATWRKYPNPLNPAVVGIDVVDRNVANGTLKSQRLISTEWGMPHWACSILGGDKVSYAVEHSEVDARRKCMTLVSKNISFSNEVSIEEKLTYLPHPNKPDATLLKQEAIITVHGIPLSSYFESFISSTISSNAQKGRQALEFVINRMGGNSLEEELHHQVI
ncbi:PRELI domain containing protein 3A [Tetranychus urticae]|uniref:PRELI/MSF1 domain-containing protein n=1 Tax=Tetranychus urticae TaxID=32264 RepID=T1KS61_TETUR|nr:PRELI domain containing protein 3A [Tetranychus urticae]